MARHFGKVTEDSTLNVFFTTQLATGARSDFSSVLEDADIVLVKDGTVATITSALTHVLTFNSDTGVYKLAIDLSADTDFTLGSDWTVYGHPDETVDSVTPAFIICTFTIETAAEQAVRRMSESLYGNQHTIGATGNTTSAFHAEGIGLSANDDCKGEIFLLVDISATPDLPVFVRATGYTESTEVVTCEQLDGTVIPFTPASGDYYFRVGQYTADVVKLAGNTANATNLSTAAGNYSAARGLTGTAVPDAAADAAGGLPISDAGGLDLDATDTAVAAIKVVTDTLARFGVVMITGATSGTPSQTVVDFTSLSHTVTTNELRGRTVLFADGTGGSQGARIVSNTASQFTMTSCTTAPATALDFLII